MRPCTAISTIAFLAALAGCGREPPAPDPSAAPVMVERTHSHRHVHGPHVDHGHTHSDFVSGTHAHEHSGH